MGQFLRKIFSIIIIGHLSLLVSAQDAVTLHIGDAAPPIKYSKWLKGTPVASYEDDRLYVLEFWATWCGPCIAAMPQLSALSKKYADNATFIGVNVWEKTGDKPYESSLANVERFVKSSGERMSYNVIADNNAQDMAKNWLTPAGIAGIPSTFVIKNNKIIWIGHPIKLDTIIGPMIAGAFDVAAFKKEYEAEKLDSNHQRMEGIKAAMKAVQDAVASKDYDEAFELIDSSIKKIPMLNYLMKAQKFKILLDHFTEAEAIIYAKQLNKEDDAYRSQIAITICDKENLSKETYLFAAENFEKDLAVRKFSYLFDKLALAYSMAGDNDSAVKAEEKAITQAKIEVKDPDFAGRVFDYTITDYQQKLKMYKKNRGKN